MTHTTQEPNILTPSIVRPKTSTLARQIKKKNRWRVAVARRWFLFSSIPVIGLVLEILLRKKYSNTFSINEHWASRLMQFLAQILMLGFLFGHLIAVSFFQAAFFETGAKIIAFFFQTFPNLWIPIGGALLLGAGYLLGSGLIRVLTHLLEATEPFKLLRRAFGMESDTRQKESGLLEEYDICNVYRKLFHMPKLQETDPNTKDMTTYQKYDEYRDKTVYLHSPEKDSKEFKQEAFFHLKRNLPKMIAKGKSFRVLVHLLDYKRGHWLKLVIDYDKKTKFINVQVYDPKPKLEKSYQLSDALFSELKSTDVNQITIQPTIYTGHQARTNGSDCGRVCLAYDEHLLENPDLSNFKMNDTRDQLRDKYNKILSTKLSQAHTYATPVIGLNTSDMLAQDTTSSATITPNSKENNTETDIPNKIPEANTYNAPDGTPAEGKLSIHNSLNVQTPK